jgi:hypothetical protein
LLIGSTPSTRAKVHSAAHHLRPPPIEVAAERRGLAVQALLATPQQPPHPRLERHQPPAHLLAVELPCPKPVPYGKQAGDFGQPPAPYYLRLTAPVLQGLEVPFQVGKRESG